MNMVPLTLVILPLISAFLILFFRKFPEKYTALFAMVVNILYVSLSIMLVVLFFTSSAYQGNIFYGVIYKTHHYELEFSLFLDSFSIMFQVITAFLTGLVITFSRRYLHKETGYNRFYSVLFLFLSGITLVGLSANLDLLFAGWEVVGISSYLLIGFYRNRIPPGRNAFRAWAIYRFCDIGLLLSAWLFHTTGHKLNFAFLSGNIFQEQVFLQNEMLFTVTGFFMLLAAMGKSAQFPFSFWLPRAMEGPTPSSAIFYGALSIHAGVFLLIRLFPVWIHIPSVRIAVGIAGSLTAIVCTLLVKTQSNVKGQIGYASVAQTGLMFLELSMGLQMIAMIHFLGNATLRCYQMLISPSSVVVLLRMQREGRGRTPEKSGLTGNMTIRKIRATLLALSLSEAYMEKIVTFLSGTFIRLTGFLQIPGAALPVLFLTGASIALTLFSSYYFQRYFYLPEAIVLGITGLWISLVALNEKRSYARIIILIFFSNVLTASAVIFLNPPYYKEIFLYHAGQIIGFILCFFPVRYLQKLYKADLVQRYYGLYFDHKLLTYIFLIGALWLSGFPLTITFLAEDLLLHFGAENSISMAFAISFTFILNGIMLMRVYTYLTFGLRYKPAT